MHITRGRSAAGVLILLGALLAVLPAAPAQAAGAVVNVPSQLPTIQAAIDAVPDGGTVVVAPGVYRENLNFHGRRIEVRSSDGPVGTVIEGAGNGPVVTFQQEETRATALRGFTVRNGDAGGIRITSASPSITGNIVTANAAYEGAGFYILESSALIEDNVIRGPEATVGLAVTGRGGVPASGVSAVVLNVTVTEPTAGGFLTAWPAGEARPLASNLNFSPGQTVPNLVVVKVGVGGVVNLFNSSASTHMVADVAGWYA